MNFIYMLHKSILFTLIFTPAGSSVPFEPKFGSASRWITQCFSAGQVRRMERCAA